MGKANHGRGEYKEQQQFVSLAAKPAPDSAGRRSRVAQQQHPQPQHQQPALPVGYMAPMSYWPADAMYVRGLQELILNQVHYYFSPENLVKVRSAGHKYLPQAGARVVPDRAVVWPTRLTPPPTGPAAAPALTHMARGPACRLAALVITSPRPEVMTGRLPPRYAAGRVSAPENGRRGMDLDWAARLV